METLPDHHSMTSRLASFFRRLSLAPKRVLWPLAMAAFVSIGVFAISEISNAHLRSTDESIKRDREILRLLGEYRAQLFEAEMGRRGYLLITREEFLEPLVSALEAIPKTQEALRDEVASVKHWRDQVAEINMDSKAILLEMEQSIEMAHEGRHEDAKAMLLESRHRLDVNALRSGIHRIEREVEADLVENLESWWVGLMLARMSIGVIVCLSLIFLAGMTRLLIDHLEQRENHRLELMAQAEELERKVSERTDELSSLSTYLQDSIEKTRAQLARDLHDEFGAILTSAKIDASWISGRLGNDQEAQDRLKRLNQVLDEAIDLKRRVIENLRPSLLDHLGLQAALEWYVTDTCEKSGIECSLSIMPEDEQLPGNVSIALYRIVQEGLNNAIKYSNCKRVSVALSKTESAWRLYLADDGIGIPNFRSDKLSHGIAGMRQRALALKGSLAIRTRPGEGTIIEVQIPLQ